MACDKYLQNSPVLGIAHHRILLDDAGNPYDYEFLEVNDTFRKLIGQEKKTLPGRTLRQVIPGIEKPDLDWIRRCGNIALNGGEASFEHYSEHLDRWYRVHVYSSEREYFTTMFFDISENKRQTEELEGFFSVNLDLLCIADLDGNFIKVNREWEHILGYSVAELEKRSFMDFVHPEDVDVTLKAIGELGEDKPVLNFVNRYRCKDGTYRFLEWRSYPKGRLIYAAARDITVRKTAEDQLRALSDNIPDGIVFQIVIDPAGQRRFSYVSAGVERVTGVTRQEVLSDSRNVYDRFHEDDIERLIKTEERAFATLEPFFCEARIRKTDGEIRWLRIKTKLDKLQDGSIVGDGIVIDFTEHKMAEEAVKKSLEEKSILLSEIHHRVKNNMAIISSLLGLQSEYSSAKIDADTLIRDLQARVLSMGSVHEIVYQTENFSEISAANLFQRIFDQLKAIYQTHDKTVVLQMESEDLMLNMNKSVPFGLFVNEVLTNIWKHAFRGKKAGRVDAEMKEKDKEMHIVIQDDGSGAPDLEKLANPSSFGCTIIHGLIQQLGGRIHFSTGTTGGLRIEAWFPLK